VVTSPVAILTVEPQTHQNMFYVDPDEEFNKLNRRNCFKQQLCGYIPKAAHITLFETGLSAISSHQFSGGLRAIDYFHGGGNA
jgi:hypothetical protein